MSIIFVLLICFANNSLAFQKAATVLEKPPLVISARLFGPVKFPTGDAPPRNFPPLMNSNTKPFSNIRVNKDRQFRYMANI